MNLREPSELRNIAPVKWHDGIPDDGISLGVADIDFDGPPGIVDYLKENLKEEFSFYQDQYGLKRCRSIIRNFLMEKGIPNSQTIQVIEGTMMGIFTTMKWISKQSGEIVMLGPIYPPIHRHATNEGNKINWIDTIQGSIVDQIAENINSDTKMIALCNPNNPTGYVYSTKELTGISDLAIDHDLYVFSDELYEPLTYSREHKSIASEQISNKSVVLFGFSKAYGLAGYRSGFMSLGSSEEDLHHIITQQLVSPSPIASLVAEYALSSKKVKRWVAEFKQQMKSNVEFGAKYLRDHGISCSTPMGSFFLFPNIEYNDKKFTETLLQKYGVQVVEGSEFGPLGINHIRINCGTSKERLKDGLDRIIRQYNSFDL